MWKLKKRKILTVKQELRRHIEDAPFYRFEYKWDDLPLDPARPFLMEKIARLKQTKPSEFHGDFDLHVYDGFEQRIDFDNKITRASKNPLEYMHKRPKMDEDRDKMNVDDDERISSTKNISTVDADEDLIRLPENLRVLKEEIKFAYSFETSAPYQYPWLQTIDLEKPSEHSVREVTNQIIKLYKERRFRIFQRHSRTKSALYSSGLRRLHGSPSDTIGSYKTKSALTLRMSALKRSQKPKRWKPGDQSKLRTTEEIKEELDEVSQVIDKFMKPDILRTTNLTVFDDYRKKINSHQDEVHKGIKKSQTRSSYENRCRPIPMTSLMAAKNKSSQFQTLTSGVVTIAEKIKCDISKTEKMRQLNVKREKLNVEQFMIKLKQQEKEKLKYMEGLLPVEPEEQKAKIFQVYHAEMIQSLKLFTNEMRLKSVNLMKNISVLELETYPSAFIKNVLRKLGKNFPYFATAYKFILKEEKLWPNIHPEVILMDYLFNPENEIREETATLITSCLIDLQEDYRYNVKRSFLRYILQSRFERRRLQLELDPPDFPILAIRAPIPWKVHIQLAKNRLDQVLMVTHPVLQALNTLWHELYNDILIFDTAKLYQNEIPLDADAISELINNCCRNAHDILVTDWLPRCADLLDSMLNTWKDLIPMNSEYGGRAAILFNCVHALMSYQLQGFILRSVFHLFHTLEMYTEGNKIEKYDPDDPKLKRRPLMTLIISVVGKHFQNNDIDSISNNSKIYTIDDDDPNLLESRQISNENTKIQHSTNFILKHTGKLFVYPYMLELPNIFVNYFKNILRVGYSIPRLEYLMSQREDQYGHLHCIDENHVDMLRLYGKVCEIVENNWTGPTTYLYPIYNYYFPLLAGKMMSITENIFTQQTIPNLQTFENLMKKFHELLEGVYYLRDYVPLNLFMLDNRHANEQLATLVQDIINFITNYFQILNLNENRRICDEFEEMSMKAGERPKETPEVVKLQDYLSECRDERIYKLKNEIKIVANRVMFLLHFATLDNEDIHLNTRTFLWPSELEQVLELSAARLNVVRDNLEVALKEKRINFEAYILSEKQKMDNFRLKESREILSLEELKEKVDTVNELTDILEKCSREAQAINNDEHLLQLDQSFFPALTELIEKMEPIEKLWKTAYEFDKNYEIWFYGTFENLNADAIREIVENMYKVVYKLSRQLVGNPTAKRVAEQIRLKIDKFKIYLPVLDAICRQGLGQRHWDAISDKLGQPCNPELFPSLKAMVDVEIMGILPQLEEISNAAGKEFELNAQLIQMKSEWTDVRFEILQYRDSDTFILASVDDVQTILDDHILKAQAMRGSPYIAALGAKADDWENKLISMQDILDIWLQVQSTWMYLEPIFSSEDIMRQMPVEGRNFKAVDKMWRKIMKNTYTDRRVIQATDYQNLLETLQKAFQDLEGVQKGLNTYLEKKRLFFARFFFLSNDELLEILSETKDPLRVQPHLKKCFEGINSLKFDQNLEITAMISSDEEVVPLTKKINPNSANGLVELWLKEVQTSMLESMLEQMWLSWNDHIKEQRLKWVLKWPGQVVQCVSCMAWTQQVEDAIGNKNLQAYLTKCNNQINDLVSLVRGSLTAGEMITIEALIVLDVHARDIVKSLLDKNITCVSDFNWIAQLRYYWKTDETNKQEYVCVSMVVTDVRYGMEYLGNISRLVVTPLTDRCYRTLMGALKLSLGGAPEGPAGSGKTETCKDLAKAVAKKCVVFNCSDGLDYMALGKFFKGMAQSGSWVCFDEFNRIKLEVLSVISQQILTIQRAISRKVIKFVFEETVLRLDPTCFMFITMNPGSAGSTELPDNLKFLFRNVAMLVPDYTMISEITLYSTGFQNARPLAQKIVNTYRLCSKQLSSQSHYDYGMRAVKSVLLASSALRRKYPSLPESQTVLRAIIDVNLPKFLEQDKELFVGIYRDLFPDVDIIEPDRNDILKWIEKKLKDKNLQATAWFIEKVLQIYEMMCIRHGLMITGGPMAGKTTAYQILAEALKAVRTDHECELKEFPVNFRIINPKAISMGQLYGCFDQVSHEWTDGVLAKTFREMAYSSISERSWVIFDGPVDAIWIENLNTVLDDNKKLCLMSGEIIQMTKMMNIIFEPSDLEQASPAIVSRCGMIYMEPSHLGWTALHKSFCQQLEGQGSFNEIYMGLYEELVTWLVPAALNALSKCKSMLKTSPIYQYQMLSSFFMHFISKTPQYNQTWFQQMFLFCFAWAYGSVLTSEGRKLFDTLIRKVLYGSNENFPRPRHFSLNRGQMFPEKLSLMDYRYDEVDNWWPWLKTAEENELPADETVQISELIVPTKETGYINYWLNYCLRAGKPILLIGPTGTGKSATIFNHIRELPKQANIINVVNFTARTTAQQIQEAIMSKLDRRRKGVFGPPVGKKCIVFCDDISMPSMDDYCSQPPLELLRQWLDHGYWSDLKDTSKLELIDLIFVGAMGLLGGSNYIYPRLYRHMYVIAVDAFEDTTLTRIFNTIGDWHFAKDYPEKVALLSKGLVDALISVYREAAATYLPTPAKSHYTFSLRDVTRVLQGIVLVPPKRLTEPEKLVRLWVHETYRVFYDRLVEQGDREQFFQLVRTACKSHMKFTLEQAMPDRIDPAGVGGTLTDDDLRGLFFGNYMEPDADPRIYDEIESYEKLEKVMHYYLQEYNTFSNAPMDLVLFRFAIEHVSRVSRVLQIPRGNILMVGVGGSGRRSSAKLSASIADAELMTIQITKTYSVNEWHDDLKKILMKAGTETKPTVFLFSDTQIVDEVFIENINTILNTGDLPNLFQAEEKAAIVENMQNLVKQLEKPMDPSPLALYAFFTERIRAHLHFALAFSPLGNSFKDRLRMYPSLVNCCTVNWFTPWPKDALTRLAEKFITEVEVDGPKELSDKHEALKSVETISSTKDEHSKKLELSSLEIRLVDMVLHFNSTVKKACVRCFSELRRKNYVTPTSYLEMLKSFKRFYKIKSDEITHLRDRYTVGLEKLDNAAGQVEQMQQNLYELQPQLKVLSEETEKIMVNIERETAEAEKKKEVVGADEAAANEAAATAQAIKDDCESDVHAATPAFNAALDALRTLENADITVVKSMKNPPAGVKLVLESVCVLKGIKPERKADPTGKVTEEYWGPSLRMLGDMKFLDTLTHFDKDNISPGIMKRIREKYISDRDFIPEKIKNISTACEGLCKWVRAMDIYDRVAKIVAPKKIALAGAEAELAQQMEKLNSKRAELQEILDKLQKLNDYFAEKSREKKRLEDEIDNCEKKLNRAEKLLGGLGGEKTRWLETANRLHKSLHNVVGDVLLAAGCIAYLGFFTTEYRMEIISDWNNLCIEKNIPCTEKFNLATTLGNPMQIRSWSLAGLPSDNFSIENGIIVKSAHRYPLMIDPQAQANSWIKNMEKDNDLKVIKLTDENYMQTVEAAIQYGHPLLLENVGEKIDSILYSVLERNIIKQKGGFYIKFADGLIEYNQNFRFYITTCHRNPHYLPEISVLVTVLNFMMTEQGLREQLLATVVVHERPDLQEKKEQLIIESAKNRNALFNIETKILQVLSSAEGNILEDENAINILSSSKTLSEEIQQKQLVAISTEREIDDARQQYFPVAKHSAILFFCITELANLDPMYQYSLAWFLNLFVNTIRKAPCSNNDLKQRLHLLNAHFTKSIYENVCRSLFEKDKLVISFVMCIGIMSEEKKVNKSHLIFFLTGGIGFDNPYTNPAPDWLSDKSWTEIVRASDLEGLENFFTNFTNNINEWHNFYDLSNPEEVPFPVPYERLDDQLLALILLKCIRSDKLVPAVRKFIVSNMGKSFVEPPLFDLEASFSESSPSIPLVFLLSQGSDPMANLFSYAKQRNMYDKCKTISLGQGQGPKAEKMILEGIKQGHWVILQNCHVAESWMDELERLCMNATMVSEAHGDYRLWCTSYPSQMFPISVLQNSVKITNEPPKGLKMNMLRSFRTDPLNNDKFFSNAFAGHVAKTWQRGVFSLVFFHAIVQERKDFGPIGWNIPYEFSDSDLKIALQQLKNFIRQYGQIPFEGHQYLTGECYYGGRVPDNKDRRVLLSMLNMIYNVKSVTEDNYSLSTSGNYRIPLTPNKVNSIEYISSNFPLSPHPEVFGLHENADINRSIKDTNLLLSGILLTQTQLLASNKPKSFVAMDSIDEQADRDFNTDSIFQLCREISSRLPNDFNIEEIAEKYPNIYGNSMNMVLRQEATRFNQLLKYIRLSLLNVQNALEGQIAMIPELERIYKSIIIGKLPTDWVAKSYSSLKPLGSYINNFLDRIEFLQNWINNGEPNVYWLSGFYFPQSFITGVLQNFSRKNNHQIDLIEMKFHITDFEQEDRTSPQVGVYIKGLFLEGARWNRRNDCLDESKPKILYDLMPVIHMEPTLKKPNAEESQHSKSEESGSDVMRKYESPIYKTSARRGSLSTTGHSTNFVMFMKLNSRIEPEHWINRGTACLCELDN